MKTLIISDFHFTETVAKKKLEYYKELFNSVDQIVINGDLWDAYKISFDEFIDSGWKELFPILKVKNTYYTYGNHDPKSVCDDRVTLYSTNSGDEFRFKSGEIEFIVQHGHFIAGDLTSKSKLANRIKYFLSYFELPIAFLTARLGQHVYSFMDIRKLKEYAYENTVGKDLPNAQYIYSHTHFAEVDTKYHYSNSGFNRFHYVQYIIVEDGKINLAKKTII